MVKLTETQKRALALIAKRDWPAGEPRRTWINKPTLAVLERLSLVEERFPDVLYLTNAGRAALEQEER